MALSREAQELLAGITGGLVGGVAAGGKVGAAAGGMSAMQHTRDRFDREDTQSREAQEQQLRRAQMMQQAKQFTISTQLRLLDMQDLDPQTKQTIAEDIAEKTGMDPGMVRMRKQQAMRFSEFITVLANPNIPEAVKQETWDNQAASFGYNTKEVSWKETFSFLQELSPDEAQSIFEELRDPNAVPDVNKVARLIANFRGPGQAMTAADASVLGLTKGTGLSLEDRMALESKRHEMRMEMSPNEVMGFVAKWFEAQAILGRSTMTPEQRDAQMDYIMESFKVMLGAIEKTVSEARGTQAAPNEESGPVDPKVVHTNNMQALREQIMAGELDTVEEAQELMAQYGDQLSPVEQDLVNKWIGEAEAAAEEEERAKEQAKGQQ